jgi:hypothetical protein
VACRRLTRFHRAIELRQLDEVDLDVLAQLQLVLTIPQAELVMVERILKEGLVEDADGQGRPQSFVNLAFDELLTVESGPVVDGRIPKLHGTCHCISRWCCWPP